MMSNDERLIYMANQIARNFEALGHEQAAAATADHIASFWDRRMRSRIDELARNGASGLGATAAVALKRLAQAQPPSQTDATSFAAVDEVGRSDAG